MLATKEELILIERAIESTKAARALAEGKAGWQWMGYVGAALQTEAGHIYTGINISVLCGIGFCAEHSAIAQMVKCGETRIARIVAATANGAILPPCGRCRELIYQIDAANVKTAVLLGVDRQRSLGDLLPEKWQDSFDRPLP